MRVLHAVMFLVGMVLLVQGTALHANGYRGYIFALDPVLQKRVQEALRDRGYNPGPIDGVFGQRSRKALYAFQADHGMTGNEYPTDILTPTLAKSLLGIDLPVGNDDDLEAEEELNLLRQLGLVPTNSYWKDQGYIFPD
jgi:hypothetical protein